MILVEPFIPPSPVQLEFLRRAEELSAPCWCFDAKLNVTKAPSSAGDAQPGQFIGAAARRCIADGELSWNAERGLLALPDATGVTIVDLTSVAAGLPRQQLVAVLKNYHRDLQQGNQDARSIEGFNQQLTQSYEEVNLIYRMSKLLAHSGDPNAVVKTMCDELRLTLNYGWTAMLFADAESVLMPLRNTIVSAGDLPCEDETFRSEAAAIDMIASPKVRTMAQCSLARRSRAEVLVERVRHGEAIIGILLAGNRRGEDPDVSSSEIQLVEAAAGFFSLFHQNAYRFAEQRQQFIGTLNALSAAVDAKDPYTFGHSERVALLASQLAAKVGFKPAEVEGVRVAGMLHDIGKIGVPEAVLRKPGKLDDEEFALIKQHPEIGYHILRDLPSLKFHLPGVLHHHERWDGRGYPHKLSGEQIPLIARIMALADTFDAMSSNRAYRKALERDHVLAEIRRSAGVQFDPALVEPFVTMDFSEFDARLTAAKENHREQAAQ